MGHGLPAQRLNARTYHVQITVGSPSRAERIATFLDASPRPFRLATERGFLTITGRYGGVPVSIVSIGMGSAMADFFVREVRESLSGDMVVVRSLPFPAPARPALA